ncbi:TPA: hypothetical protein ACGGRP_004442 [Escherichia coli]
MMKWNKIAFIFVLIPFFGKAATYIAAQSPNYRNSGMNSIGGQSSGFGRVYELGGGRFFANWGNDGTGGYSIDGFNLWDLLFYIVYPPECTLPIDLGYADVSVDWGGPYYPYLGGQAGPYRLSYQGLFRASYIDKETRGWAFFLNADAHLSPTLQCNSNASELYGELRFHGTVNNRVYAAYTSIRYIRTSEPAGIRLSPGNVSCQANLGDICKTDPVRLEYVSDNVSTHWVASLFTPSNGITYISDTGEKHALTITPQVIARGEKTPPGGVLASGTFTISNLDGNVGLARHNINYTVTFD